MKSGTRVCSARSATCVASGPENASSAETGFSLKVISLLESCPYKMATATGRPVQTQSMARPTARRRRTKSSVRIKIFNEHLRVSRRGRWTPDLE